MNSFRFLLFFFILDSLKQNEDVNELAALQMLTMGTRGTQKPMSNSLGHSPKEVGSTGSFSLWNLPIIISIRKWAAPFCLPLLARRRLLGLNLVFGKGGDRLDSGRWIRPTACSCSWKTQSADSRGREIGFPWILGIFLVGDIHEASQ